MGTATDTKDTADWGKGQTCDASTWTTTSKCRFDATRRVLVGCGDPPDPDQSGFAGTIYIVQVCKQHDPDPRRSMPLPRWRTSTPIGERPRR